jgi:hypothetical protein
MGKQVCLTVEEVEEVKDCNGEGLCECYCDNTHKQNNTVCMYCLLWERAEQRAKQTL